MSDAFDPHDSPFVKKIKKQLRQHKVYEKEALADGVSQEFIDSVRPFSLEEIEAAARKV